MVISVPSLNQTPCRDVQECVRKPVLISNAGLGPANAIINTRRDARRSLNEVKDEEGEARMLAGLATLP